MVPAGFKELESKEVRMFENRSMLTSSADFIKAVRADKIEEAKAILAINDKAIKSVDLQDRNKSAFHLAVEKGDLEMMRFLVTQKYASLEMVDKEGATPLFYAIMKKNFEMVKFLDEHGAYFEHREVLLRTPVYFAASNGSNDIIKYLIKKGCNVNTPSSMGRTALGKACWNGNVEIT